MIYTKEKFKELWEANKYGSGITYNDIAECAVAWGILVDPRTRPLNEITYKVLKAAQTNDAEEYNPTPQREERIMIDLDKACKYLEEYTPQKFEDVQNYIENFRKAMKGDKL